MANQDVTKGRSELKISFWILTGSIFMAVIFGLINLAGARYAGSSFFVYLPLLTNGASGVLLEGYGTDSTFGVGPSSEQCVVTSLANSGAGTLRECIEERTGPVTNPVPRTITFNVGGTITLQSALPIRQPYLTVDGLSAPAPGITIEKGGDGLFNGLSVSTWPSQNTCGHDVLVQGVRLVGVWTRDTTDHSQNAGIFGLDGEDLVGCLNKIVLNRATIIDGQDSAGDIWGSATNVTYQYTAFFHNYHPNTMSHWPGGEESQRRENVSIHHNLYAYSHERNPQIRGNTRNFNYDQNIIHLWDAYGFPGGYGVRVRCRNGGCPENYNFTENHWTTASGSPADALILGDVRGADPDEALIAPELYMSGNFLPPENVDWGTALFEFPRPTIAEVTLFADNELVSQVLPNIGVPYRTSEEEAIFAEVGAQIQQDQN